MRKLAALVAMNLFLAFQAVNSQSVLYNYFPEKIRVLIAIKPEEIGRKIPAEVLNESFLVNGDQKKGRNDKMLEILRDLKSTGVHLHEAFIVFSEGKQSGSKITHLLVRLENPASFKNFLVEKAKMDPEKIRTYGTDNVVILEETVVAWNHKVAIVASDKGDDMTEVYNDTLAVSVDTLMEGDYEKWYEVQREKKQKELRNLAFELLTPRPGNAFILDPRFQSLMNEPGELKIWNEQRDEPLGIFLPMQNLIGQLSKLTPGLKTSAIEFAQGKIIARSRTYPGEDMVKLLEKNPMLPAGEEFLDRIPEGKILAVLNGSIGNAMMEEMFKMPVFLELADSIKRYSSFDIRKLPTIFGNKLVGAVLYEEGSQPEIDLILGIPIRDLAGFKTMQSELGRMIDSMTKEDSGHFPGKFRPLVRTNDKLLAISLSESSAESFLSKKGTQSVPAHLRAYAKFPVMLNLNFAELIRSFVMKEARRTSPEDLQFLDQMGDILVYGGEFREGATTMNVEVNFKDASQNSLAQIFGIMNGMMEMMTKNKVSREESAEEENETVAADTADTRCQNGLLRLMIPKLKDNKVRKFLEEYTDVVLEYQEALAESAVNMEAEKKYLLWQERARILGTQIEDKEDVEKFHDFLSTLERSIAACKDSLKAEE